MVTSSGGIEGIPAFDNLNVDGELYCQEDEARLHYHRDVGKDFLTTPFLDRTKGGVLRSARCDLQT